MKRFFGVFKKCVILIAVLGMLVNNIGFVHAAGTEPELVNINEATIEEIPAQPYTGTEIRPSLKITYGGKELKLGEQYTWSLQNNIKAIDESGIDASITIYGLDRGGYTGSRTINFTIVKIKDLSQATVSLYSDAQHTKNIYIYNDGNEIKPYEVVTLSGKTLIKDTDYTVSYENNKEVSSESSLGKVKITAKGDYYTGEYVKEFSITSKDVVRPNNAVFYNDKEYDGKSHSLIEQGYSSDKAASIKYGWYDSPDSTTTPSIFYSDYNSDVFKKKDAGTYKLFVLITPQNGYKFIDNPFSVNITIKKRTPVVGAPVLASNLPYNNDNQKLIATAATPDKVDDADKKGGNCEISYATKYVSFEDYNESTPPSAPNVNDTTAWKTSVDDVVGKDAGYYYVWYKVKGTDNFEDISPKLVGTAIINKFTPTADSYDLEQEKDYTGSSIDADSLEDSIVLAGKTGNVEAYSSETHGAIKYEYSKWLSKVENVDTYDTATTTAPTEVNGENPYKVTITFPESKNYNSITINATLKITRVNPTVEAPTLVNTEYKNADIDLITTAATTNFGVIKYYVGESEPTGDESNEWKTSISKKDVGKYKVWYKSFNLDSSNNISDNFTASDVKGGNYAEITKATPTITVSSKSVNYDGNTKEIDAATVTLVTGETYNKDTHGDLIYEYYLKDDYEEENKLSSLPVNVGTYYVKVTLPEKGNYKVGSATTTLEIKKVDPKVTKEPKLKSELVYNASEQALIYEAGTVTDTCTIKYAIGTKNSVSNSADDWKDSISNIKRTDVGEYYIWYKVVGNDNYNNLDPKLITGSVKIVAADQTVDPPSLIDNVDYKPEYETNALNLIKSDGNAVAKFKDINIHSGGKVKYLVTSSTITSVTGLETGWAETATAKTAGTYKVWYMAEADSSGKGNFKASSIECANKTVTINKINPSFTTDPALVNGPLTYNTESQEFIDKPGEVTGGTIKYAFGESSTSIGSNPVWTDNPGNIAKTDAGTYYVWYKVVGNDNYIDISEKNLGSITIKKAASSITTVPKAKDNLAYTGSDIELIDAGVATGGTLEYALVDSTTAPADDSSEWTSTYTDIKAKAISTDSNQYYVWYRVKGNNNYDGIATNGPLNPKIDKATIALKAIQDASGDIVITTDPFNLEYINSLSSGNIKITIPDKGEVVVSGNDIKIDKDSSGKNIGLRIPYSNFEDKNKQIDRYDEHGNPNKFGIIPSSVDNFNNVTGSVDTTRGKEYINLYKQAEPNLELSEDTIFYVDGKPIDKNLAKKYPVEENQTTIVQTYNYLSNKEEDIYKDNNYPISFKVYKITHIIDETSIRLATVKHLVGLDNSMEYIGTSIKVSTTEENGIRVITGVPLETRNNLINSNVEGYKLVEYGTVISWQASLKMPNMVPGQSGVFVACTNASSGIAYGIVNGKRYDQIFQQDKDYIYYTNILTDPNNTWINNLKDNLVFRSFMVLKPIDENEKQNIVIYGGVINRSIYGVAKQNLNTSFYNDNPTAKAYIDRIIDAADKKQD